MRNHWHHVVHSFQWMQSKGEAEQCTSASTVDVYPFVLIFMHCRIKVVEQTKVNPEGTSTLWFTFVLFELAVIHVVIITISTTTIMTELGHL